MVEEKLYSRYEEENSQRYLEESKLNQASRLKWAIRGDRQRVEGGCLGSKRGKERRGGQERNQELRAPQELRGCVAIGKEAGGREPNSRSGEV